MQNFFLAPNQVVTDSKSQPMFKHPVIPLDYGESTFSSKPQYRTQQLCILLIKKTKWTEQLSPTLVIGDRSTWKLFFFLGFQGEPPIVLALRGSEWGAQRPAQQSEAILGDITKNHLSSSSNPVILFTCSSADTIALIPPPC